MPKLKVFRTPIGFHDAYVAAPSRKAALAAWGSTHDLFARGVAEEVTDPAFMAEALAAPGTVIKRSRGTTAEQIAALPPDRKRAKETVADAPAVTPKPEPKPKPKPRPARSALDAAEAAVTEAEARQRRDDDSLRERIAALEDERKTLARERRAEIGRLDEARKAEATAYDRAMRAWRG